jgi:hypothetical protein
MNKIPAIKVPGFVKFLALGLVVAGIVVGISLYSNRGSHVGLEGSIVKVRLVATDENSCIGVLELRLNNPARVRFVVDTVSLTVRDSKGQTLTATSIPQIDLDRVLDYFKLAGPRYNPVLRMKENIPGETAVERTVAGSFAVPEAVLAGRQDFRVAITDVDGAVREIAEKR